MISFLQNFGPADSPTLQPDTPAVGVHQCAPKHGVGQVPQHQVTLDEAIEAAERGMALAIDKAQRTDPTFSERASAAILAHLRVVGECSGEELTDIARSHGAVPPDDRAFGSVFKSLSRKGLIRHAGFCLRRKGHATAGGRVWRIAS